MGGKGSKAPPPPDYGPIAQQQSEAASLARQTSIDQLAWAKEEFKQNKDILNKVLDTQLPIMQSEAEEGKKLRERYNTVFQPIEDELVKESRAYASGERADYDASRAMGDVGQAFEASRSNALANMESYGIDPSQTRASALDAGIRVQEAAAKAATATQSRINTENIGRALRSEAINLGKGLPANIAGAYGTAINAGQTGLQGALNTTGSGGNTMGTANQWAGTQQSALSSWGNTLGQQFAGQQQASAAKSEQSGKAGSAIGSLAGMAIGSMIMPGVGTAMGGALGGAAGGMVAEGGRIPDDPQDPQGNRDTFDAKLSGGEHVIPASAVRRLGSDHFDKLIAKHGNEVDRKAAQERLRTGRPGGEPTQPETKRRALQQHVDQRRVSALGMRAVA